MRVNYGISTVHDCKRLGGKEPFVIPVYRNRHEVVILDVSICSVCLHMWEKMHKKTFSINPKQNTREQDD